MSSASNVYGDHHTYTHGRTHGAPDVVLVALVGGAVDAHARRVDVDGQAVVGPGGARVALARGRDGERGGGGGRAGVPVVCVGREMDPGVRRRRGRKRRWVVSWVYRRQPVLYSMNAPRVLPVIARGNDHHHTQVREAGDGVVDGGAIRLGVSECVCLWKEFADRAHT